MSNGDDRRAELQALLEGFSGPAAGEDRPGGGGGERLERARGALELLAAHPDLLPPETGDRLRASLLTVLAAELLSTPRPDRPARLEEALDALAAALELLDEEGDRESWSLTRVLLGRTLLERSAGRHADNVELALESLLAARRVQREGSAGAAEVDLLLADAFLQRLHGDRPTSVEAALGHAERAVEVYTEIGTMLPWASAQYLSGLAYRRRRGGEREENLTAAIRCFERAVEVKRDQGTPRDRLEAEVALADARGELAVVRRNLGGRELVRREEATPTDRGGRGAPTRGLGRGPGRGSVDRGEPDLDEVFDDLEAELEGDHSAEEAMTGESPPPAWDDFEDEMEADDDAGDTLGGERPPPAWDLDLDAELEEAAPQPSDSPEASLEEQEEEGAPARMRERLAEARAADEGPAPREVNTGFADSGAPAAGLDSTEPLAPDTGYLFWFEIATERLPGSIDDRAAPLPADLPAAAELEVVLFGFEGGLEIDADADVGRLRLTAGGARVLDQPRSGPPADEDDEVARRRLLFPVRTPSSAKGPARLRCNLYHRGLLLQSRRVTAWVGERPPEGAPALAAEVDFVLSSSLDPAALAAHGDHPLSLLVNDDGERTHGLRAWAGPGLKLENRIGEGALSDQMRQARGALRRVAWGSEKSWDEPAAGETEPPKRKYRYGETVPDSATRLRDDLALLARRGYRFFTRALTGLDAADLDPAARGLEKARQLIEKLPGGARVQIVQPRGGTVGPVVLPAALFYDIIGLDTNTAPDDYRLCPDFEAALDAGEELAGQPCFTGRCPVRDDRQAARTTICPSGFWGYRLALGLPASVAPGGDAAQAIPYSGQPDLTLGVSLDPDFVLRDDHIGRLQALRQVGWNYGDSRDEVLELLELTHPHLVYLYCHGGLAGTLPYLLVGPEGEIGITPDNLFTVFWRTPRPLVFLNGCHTTALAPEHAFQFVTQLVESSQAAGVIGTEITVFESLAGAFAEACLKGFLVDELPIGEAVRRARLTLLAAGNPLGLVYIPYALPGIKLVAAS